nr:TIGR03862 family flavoprotein [Paracoccus sp. C2R09]
MIVGAGPAGLMAAEMLAAPGRRIVLADAMPSPARKFLMAGKSGLNLTKAEDAADFARHFAGSVDPQTGDFDPRAVMDWAEGLGIELFTGSTGRVFPVGMKASPLLRAWLARLEDVDLRRRWRWTAMQGGVFGFDTPGGPRWIAPRVTVLALGGASWPRLGSDAAWVPMLRDAGVDVASFRPANMGFRVDWSEPMRRHLGAAVKGVAIHAGGLIGRGEWVIGAQGVEGGGIYEVSAPMRDGADAHVDLAPDLDHAALARRFAKPRGKLSLGNWLRRAIGDPVKVALLLEWGQPLPKDAQALAALTKALPLRHDGPMGLVGAISAAGGITGDALTKDLELRALPGTFAAGEMLDWEAPTGGYLLTACLATGRRAGLAAARHLDQSAQACR